MIPHDIDPSLHASAPLLDTLEDGFSPRSDDANDEEAEREEDTVEPVDPPMEPELPPKSPF